MTEDGFCPVHHAIQILQEKWTLHIIRTLLQGPCGFNELSRAVGGCNPATLTHRLESLEELGLVKKEVLSMMPPRSSYSLTPAGVELQGVVDAIGKWAMNHLSTCKAKAQSVK
ncbi:winged helix-turn-helix transcriptional regulator [Deinococcus misasensis]|uniref:winged helix-turn-helix transcriptional regulator n=1 Tax=Deinococcus misasensis TaxID=392413 RepID=UPI0005598BB1|nr:helix-turn-helix domain-containing protein [Deinococcus misasensis]